MTTSTTFDPCRIASLPGTGGGHMAAPRLEAPAAAQPMAELRHEQHMRASRSMAAELRALVQVVVLARRRAIAAIDKAEAALPDRPKFELQGMRPTGVIVDELKTLRTIEGKAALRQAVLDEHFGKDSVVVRMRYLDVGM